MEAGWENKKKHTLAFECLEFQLLLKRTVLKDIERKLIFSLNNLRPDESENVTGAAIGNIKSEFRNSDSNLNALTPIRMLGRLYFLRVRAIQTPNEREVFFGFVTIVCRKRKYSASAGAGAGQAFVYVQPTDNHRRMQDVKNGACFFFSFMNKDRFLFIDTFHTSF